MQKKISSTPVYEGTIFHMSRDEVEIKGKTYPRDVIHHDGGVGVLAIRDGKILLVKQYVWKYNNPLLLPLQWQRGCEDRPCYHLTI